MMPLQTIPIVVVLIATLFASVTDLWRFRVYNALTFPLLLTGLIYHGVMGGVSGLGDSFQGLLFGFFSLVFFYAAGGIGAGDVKLMAAVGAWLGMPLTFYVFIASSLAAGLYATALIILSGGWFEIWTQLNLLLVKLTLGTKRLPSDQRVETVAAQPGRRKRLIPFALMMLMGFIASLVYIQNQS